MKLMCTTHTALHIHHCFVWQKEFKLCERAKVTVCSVNQKKYLSGLEVNANLWGKLVLLRYFVIRAGDLFEMRILMLF